MKKNELKELKNKTVEEITKDIVVLKKEIVELSHDIKMGKSTASALLRTKKKHVARLLTIIGQMRLNSVLVKKTEDTSVEIAKSETKTKKTLKKTKGETK